MLFNSLDFAIFFVVVWLGAWVSRGRLRKYWLLSASYYFYGSWKVEYLALLGGSTLVSYLVGLSLGPGRRGRGLWLAFGVGFNLAVLFAFKYLNFAGKLRRHAKRRCRGIRRAVERSLAYDPSVPDQVYAAVERTVGHARERGVHLVLFTPPYHDEYLRCIPDAWKREVRGRMERLRQQGAEYHDFHADPEFVRTHLWFGNSDHLNKRGSRPFSRKLADVAGVKDR